VPTVQLDRGPMTEKSPTKIDPIPALCTPCPACNVRIISLIWTSRELGQLAWRGECDRCGYVLYLYARPAVVKWAAT